MPTVKRQPGLGRVCVGPEVYQVCVIPFWIPGAIFHMHRGGRPAFFCLQPAHHAGSLREGGNLTLLSGIPVEVFVKTGEKDGYVPPAEAVV